MSDIYPRTLGDKLPISIATAVPLEEVILQEGMRKVLFLNLDTLIRNYYESYDKDVDTPIDVLVAGFLEEMQTLLSILHDKVPVTVYVTERKWLPILIPLAKIKTPKTDKQMYTSNRVRLIRNEAMKSNLPIIHCRQLIPGENQDAYIITHHAMDLLSDYNFSSLTLLSSHTGDTLGRKDWIRRLTNNKDYHRLPFSLLTLVILGDRATIFLALPTAMKRPFLTLAAEHLWIPTTTKAKMLKDISTMADKATADNYRSIIYTKLK